MFGSSGAVLWARERVGALQNSKSWETPSFKKKTNMRDLGLKIHHYRTQTGAFSSSIQSLCPIVGPCDSQPINIWRVIIMISAWRATVHGEIKGKGGDVFIQFAIGSLISFN